MPISDFYVVEGHSLCCFVNSRTCLLNLSLFHAAFLVKTVPIQDYSVYYVSEIHCVALRQSLHVSLHLSQSQAAFMAENFAYF